MNPETGFKKNAVSSEIFASCLAIFIFSNCKQVLEFANEYSCSL